MIFFLPAKLGDLEDAGKAGFLVRPKYFDWNIPRSEDKILLRPHVIEALLGAEKKLPNPLRFLLWDGYRTFETQKFLYDDLFERRKKILPDASDDEIHALTKKFLNFPSVDVEKPSPHLTGCAIDLTLYDTEKKICLDMGTDFDDFSERASSSFFDYNPPQTILDEINFRNRKVLRKIMLSLGFLPHPNEWWHYELHS